MSAFPKQVQVECSEGRLHHARSLNAYCKVPVRQPQLLGPEAVCEILLRRNLTAHM
jgi:hypothetical protein